MKLTGTAAIEYAEAHDLTLSKYNDPTEDAREGLTPDEARKVASEDPRLIYVEVTDAETLAASHISGNDYEFRLGDAVAYGTMEYDEETGEFLSGSVDHSPTQEWYDRIAAAVDALEDDEFFRLCLNAKEEGR